MPKMKTRKSLIKKVKLTKGGKGKKVMRQATHQNHGNAKENGNYGRAKKSEKRLFSADEKNVLKAIKG